MNKFIAANLVISAYNILCTFAIMLCIWLRIGLPGWPLMVAWGSVEIILYIVVCIVMSP